MRRGPQHPRQIPGRAKWPQRIPLDAGQDVLRREYNHAARRLVDSYSATGNVDAEDLDLVNSLDSEQRITDTLKLTARDLRWFVRTTMQRDPDDDDWTAELLARERNNPALDHAIRSNLLVQETVLPTRPDQNAVDWMTLGAEVRQHSTEMAFEPAAGRYLHAPAIDPNAWPWEGPTDAWKAIGIADRPWLRLGNDVMRERPFAPLRRVPVAEDFAGRPLPGENQPRFPGAGASGVVRGHSQQSSDASHHLMGTGTSRRLIKRALGRVTPY